MIIEEAPQQQPARHGLVSHHEHGHGHGQEGEGNEPLQQHHHQQHPAATAMMAGAEGEAEPIRVRRTADPLKLQVLFGYDDAPQQQPQPQGAAALGPRVFAMRVPRFYPHSVRVGFGGWVAFRSVGPGGRHAFPLLGLTHPPTHAPTKPKQNQTKHRRPL